MKHFDASSWIGHWPFGLEPALGPAELAARLRRGGVARALVSPLAAVFAPEPGPANRDLLEETRKFGSLVPVPVINPRLANWRDQLAEVAADRRVRAVRVLPAYHDYRLGSPAMAELAAELDARGLRLLVQARLIDERHEFHALTIQPVPAKEVGAFLRRAPRRPVLVSGLLRAELLGLAADHPQMLADLSFVEWHDTLASLRGKVPARQVAFATHTPFLVTGAARAKLDAAPLGTRDRALIAGGNLDKFLA